VALQFDISSRFLAVAGDKIVHVLHNVVGIKASVTDLEEKKRKATTGAMRERLQDQINDNKELLKKLGAE